jgi:futalosine hydrolase
MFLIVCATEFEIQPLLKQCVPDDHWDYLVTGVGIVETTLALTRYFDAGKGVEVVINIGVAGAYVYDGNQKADLLEICIARRETLGDLGICHGDRIEPLADHLLHAAHYNLDPDLISQAECLLRAAQIVPRQGNFITVSGVSATQQRGAMLGTMYQGLCENMEGGAVARVCHEFKLPLLEMRAVSNLVEDRDMEQWKLGAASERIGTAAALVLKGLTGK